MKSNIEYRTAATLRAAAGSAFELAGLAAAYNKLSGNLGGFRERIAPGAFTRSLASDPNVVCLFNHDQSKVLGRTKSGTLTLSDSPEGLRFVCRLDPNQQSHKDLYSSVQRGDISECSFAFNVDGDGEEWDEARDEQGARFSRRTLTNLKLHDVSVVTTPAYPGSTSVGARSSSIIVPRNESMVDAANRATLARQTTEIIRMKRKAISEFESDQQLRERLAEAGRSIRAQILEEIMED